MLLAEDHTQISFWLKNKLFKSASLFTTVNDCGVIEGSFSRTKTSLSDLVLPVRCCRWLVKDMCKSRLLLNDMPVFHENLFKIRCGRVISGNKQ